MIKNLKLNIVAIWSQRAVLIGSSIILVPLLTGALGKERYGIWLLALQFVSQYNLLQVGFNNSLIRFLPSFLKKKNDYEVARYFNVCLYFLLGLSLTISILNISLYFIIPEIYNSFYEENSELLFVMLFVTLEFCIAIVLRIGGGYLDAIQKLYYGMINQSVFQVFFVLILLYLNFLNNLNLRTLTLSYFCVHTIKNVQLAVFVQRKFINFKLRPLWNKEIFKKFLDLGASNVGMRLSYMLIQPGILLLIGFLYGPESIAVIAIPLMIHVSLSPIANVLSRVLTPVAAKAQNNDGEKKQVGELIFKLFLRVNIFSLFTMITFAILGSSLIELWLNDNYSKTDQKIIFDLLLISLLILFINAPAMAIRSTMMASGNHWRATKSELVNNIVGCAIGLATLFVLDVNYSIMAAIFFSATLRLFSKSAFFGMRYYYLKRQYLFMYTLLLFAYFSIAQMMVNSFVLDFGFLKWI